MRRAWVVIVSACLVTAIGCGKENYDLRMQATLKKLQKEQRIKKNLMEAPDDKKFKEQAIYVRAPKEEAYTKTGQLPVTEGQFDLDASFNDKTDASLHVLARVKKVKKTTTKGAPPTPPPVARGAFDADVISVLSTVFGSPDALLTPKFTEEVKGGNRFKRLIFMANEKEVKVYIYKQDIYDVALIFVYDTKLKGPLATKIELCLESFAVGQKAQRLYEGGKPDDEGEGGPAGPV